MALQKPRIQVPEKAKLGELIEIKTSISHIMETGDRKDAKTGQFVPRRIVNTFAAKFNGKEIFRAKLQPAISANPFIGFFMKVPGPGEFEFTWVEDGGAVVSEKVKLALEGTD
jgi:sulfur-oxidizing protein SoxZ